MYEYKVKGAEVAMNKLAGKGWRVIAVSPNMGIGLSEKCMKLHQ